MILSTEQARRVECREQTLLLFLVRAGEFASGGQGPTVQAVWRYKPRLRGSTGLEQRQQEELARCAWGELEAIATPVFVVDSGQDGVVMPRPDYPICPGGGQPALCRVRVTGIRKVRLQELTEEDVAAYAPRASLFGLRYSPGLRKLTDERYPLATAVAGLLGGRRGQLAVEWDEGHKRRGTRYYDNPEVWALTVARRWVTVSTE